MTDKLDTYVHRLERERDELRAENERLQRENGSLARTYAACERMLRERTGQLNQDDAENERLRAQVAAFEEDWQKRHLGVIEDNERLRAVLTNLEHPSGRPCPWCLTPTGFVHGRHCELAAALGFDKEC